MLNDHISKAESHSKALKHPRPVHVLSLPSRYTLYSLVRHHHHYNISVQDYFVLLNVPVLLRVSTKPVPF